MRDEDGLQLALSLLTAACNVLSHLQQAQQGSTSGVNTHHNRVTRRPQPSNGASLPTIAPGALINLKIDAERDYEVDEAAKRMGISAQTVRKMIVEERLKAERRGNGRGRWYIQGSEILKFTDHIDDQQH